MTPAIASVTVLEDERAGDAVDAELRVLTLRGLGRVLGQRAAGVGDLDEVRPGVAGRAVGEDDVPELTAAA